MLVPVGRSLVLLLCHGLNSLTELSLSAEVILLLGAKIIEMLLVFLVDNGAGSLKACPYLLAKVLGHRSYLTVLLVKVLQLMECADDIRLVGEFLRSLTKLGLGLQVLLEVVLTGLAV